MSGTISLRSANGQLTFSSVNGNILELTADTRTVSLAGKPFFTLGLLNKEGDTVIVSSEDFQFKAEASANQLTFVYTAHPEYPDMKVTVWCHTENEFYHFRPEVRSVPEACLLEWIDVPQVVTPKNGHLFWPFAEGVIINDPMVRQGSPWTRYHVMGFLKRTEGIAFSEGGYYPGVCQMQFMAWQDEKSVLYFGAHDPHHGTKGVEYEPFPDGTSRLSLQTFCGAQNPYMPDFDYVLGMVPGDWMNACSIYRDWIEKDPTMPPKGALPEMVKKSPVVMIYPVRGCGDDKGEMKVGNEYFPYMNAMPYVRKYADAFDSPILSLLMHWEGTAPWAPPYVWPPFGGVGMLKEYSDALHAEGHYLGVYCSGTAWTQVSCITDYSREKECEEKGLRRHMIRGPKGEIEACICCAPQAQRLGFDMCLTQEWSRQTMKDELKKLTTCDIDYVQLFDQNLGGGYHTCYAHTHNHPDAPGTWQTTAMQSLLKELVDETRDCSHPIIMGCEGASADAYLKGLPFNDLRSGWNFSRGVPVPAYQFIFHEYCNNFMGNQCGITGTLDEKKCPAHFYYRAAYAFAYGDLLSILLKDAGQIHWGWGALWSLEGPDQDKCIDFVRTLNDMRKKYGKFLQYGRMEIPSVKVNCGTYKLYTHSGLVYERPSCMISEFSAQDGSTAGFIVNYLPETQNITCELPGENGKQHAFELAPLSVMILLRNAAGEWKAEFSI